MAAIKLPDGSTVMQLAQSIGPGQAKAAIAGKVDGKLVDLASTYEVFITTKNSIGRAICRVHFKYRSP